MIHEPAACFEKLRQTAYSWKDVLEHIEPGGHGRQEVPHKTSCDFVRQFVQHLDRESAMKESLNFFIARLCMYVTLVNFTQ